MNIEEYEKIIKEIEEKDICGVTKLQIVSDMKSFEQYKTLSDAGKEKMLDYIYSYWIDNDLWEHTLYDVVELIMNATQHGFTDIVSIIDKIDYRTFENIVNGRI